MAYFIIFSIVGLAIVLMANNGKGWRKTNATSIEDAVSDARRWIERLGSQVLSLSGTDAASTQALADASERYNAASGQISTAKSARQAQLAKESALEGLYYVQAAREIMGLPAGPPLPELESQRKAGAVTEERTIEHEGHTITASPHPTSATPNYYPGGMVAGRPVPAGWYSEPWWAGALRSGMWTAGSVMMFSMLFNGMSGVNYSAHAFEQGYGDGYQDGLDAAHTDMGDDMGAIDSGDGGFFDGDFGGFDGFDF